MIMMETTKLLHDIQKQVIRLNEIETYENVPRPSTSRHPQPLSEFEEGTDWMFNPGSAMPQEVQRVTTRPPVPPPPVRQSSLPRGVSASQQYYQQQQQQQQPPPRMLIPAELQ